jgi:type IV secretion system protein VirD4
MTPTKLLVGQILIVFAIVIVGVWFATEWCAAELGFQPQLGSPWFVLLGVPVYCPWQLFAWWFWYDAHAPAVFNKAGAIAALPAVPSRSSARCGGRGRTAGHHPRVLVLGDRP